MLARFGPFAVYFSFADGALGYHCRECGYRCCRGAGFGATRDELVQLSRRYPLLPMFVVPQRDPAEPLVNLTNFSPSCFFLQGDGLCRVEVEHGRELKPYVCRAFPANQLQRSGVLLVAELNFLCPLQPAAGRGDVVPVRHAQVMADLHAAIEVPAQLASQPETLFPLALLEHEAHLRDLPIAEDEDLLGRLAYADLVAPRWRSEPQPPSAPFVAAHRAYLAGLRGQMLALLGLDGAGEPTGPRFGRELALMMPRLRLALLRQRTDGDDGIDRLLPQLGRRVLAVSVYVELIARLGAEVTLGVVDQASRQGQLFCELLAMVDRVPTLVPTDDAAPIVLYRTQEAAMQRLLRFLHEENAHRRLTLGEVLHEIGVDDPAARAQLCQSFTREALPRFRFDPT